MEEEVIIFKTRNEELLPQGINLSDSFILDWEFKNEKFKILLELSIWPESPYYQKPNENEFTFYRKGVLIFSEVNYISGYTSLNSIPSNIDPVNSKDWGHI
jgi:hypothetical protein